MRRHRPDDLTTREREVISLVRLGLTNEEIAERLGITLDGAKYHVSQILSKLGVATREEAAAVALGERRRWWAAWPLAAKIGGAAVVTAAVAGVAVLAWGVLRTEGSVKQITGEIGMYEDRNGFHPFAEKLARAVEERDVQFFVDNGPEGQLSIGVLEPAGPGVLTADYEDFVQHYLTSVAEEESDPFGDASPRLHAYSIIKPELGGRTPEGTVETVNVIVTSRAPGPPGDIPPAGRTVLVVDATFDGERWSISRLTLAGGDNDPELVVAYLEAPTNLGGGIFDFWQRWEPSPTP